jgi:cyanophycin synthetase
MRILNLRATVGPNIYSIDHPHLTVMRMSFEQDLGIRLDYFPGAVKKLRDLGAPGGIQEASTLPLVLAHLGIWLQNMLGLQLGFTHVHTVLEPGVVNVVFECATESTGDEAGRCAIEILQAAMRGQKAGELAALREKAHARVLAAYRRSRLLFSTQALVDEAAKRGIPHFVLNQHSLVQLGYGCHQQRIQDTITETTSAIAVELAGDKFAASELLRGMDVPVPQQRVIRNEKNIESVIDRLQFPVVIKPVGGHQGLGVTTGITTMPEAVEAFKRAKLHGKDILFEEHVQGSDFRALIINNRFVAASRREPASVTGNGTSSVFELVAEANKDPRRGHDHEKPLTFLQLDEVALDCLQKQNLTQESIPEAGRHVALQTGANLSTGGTATDVTETVHPENARLFERVAHFIGLDVAGLDVVAPSLGTPLSDNGGRIIEINAAPGFRMHLHPSEGIPRNVCAPVIDRLFPSSLPSRIPILTVTGTNGKTTTTRLLAHILRTIGRQVGFTSSDGIYLGLHRVKSGDMTGPTSTRIVLKDPWVDTAVFEYPRGGLIRAGLGFDRSEVGVVLNVTPDHLGSRDIHTVEEMAHVKSIVARSVLKDGYAVLNADDDLVYAMRDVASGNVALFSLLPYNPRILKHIGKGGLCALLREGRIVIHRGEWAYPLGHAAEFPLTFEGQATFNIQNILAAGLAAFCHGLKPHQIRQGLLTFDPSYTLTPGRMNVFYGDGFRVLVDYAHNIDSMRAVDKFLHTTKLGTRLVAVVGGTGDRMDQDIRDLGHQTGSMFDRVIVREDADTRGRPRGETAEIFRQGIVAAKPSILCETVLDSGAAIRRAITTALPGDLVCVLGGDVENSLEVVKQLCRVTP